MSREAARLTLALFVLIAGGILALQVVLLPRLTADLSAALPEYAHLAAPLSILAVAAGVCVQLGAVVAGRLVLLGRGRADNRAWLRSVDGLAALLATATLIVLAAHLVLLDAGTGGPPALSLLMLACIVGGAALVVLLVQFRARTGRAVGLSPLQAEPPTLKG